MFLPETIFIEFATAIRTGRDGPTGDFFDKLVALIQLPGSTGRVLIGKGSGDIEDAERESPITFPGAEHAIDWEFSRLVLDSQLQTRAFRKWSPSVVDLIQSREVKPRQLELIDHNVATLKQVRPDIWLEAKTAPTNSKTTDHLADIAKEYCTPHTRKKKSRT